MKLNQKRKLGRIYVELSNQLAHYAFRFVHSQADVENILQEACREMLDNSETLSKNDDEVKAYLFKTVHNISVEELKRRRKAQAAAGEPGLAESITHWLDPEGDLMVYRFSVEEFSGCLGELDLSVRWMISYKYQCGLNNMEIAEILGCTESEVESELLCAKEALREKMEVLLDE